MVNERIGAEFPVRVQRDRRATRALVLAASWLLSTAALGQGYLPCPSSEEPLLTVSGQLPGDTLGASIVGGAVSAVTFVGDVDGDGFDDVLAGSSSHSAPAGLSGMARAYSGRTGAPLLSVYGALRDELGTAVAGAGDVDLDGYADLIVGAPGTAYNHKGYVLLLSGRSGEELLRLEGDSNDDALGFSVTGLGDVNGDGVPDLAAGAPGAHPVGYVRAYSGADGSTLYTLLGDTSVQCAPGVTGGPGFGWSLDAIGDVTGDGKSELAVGNPLFNKSTGRAAVHDGGTGALLWEERKISYDCPSGEPWDFGRAVAGVGDYDGDGVPDWAVSAPGEDSFHGGSNQFIGRVKVYSGAAPHGVLFDRFGEDLGGHFGWSLAAAGDVNGDGYADFLASAPFDDSVPAAGAEGRATLFLGPSGAVHRVLEPGVDMTNFGLGLAGGGDTNGDGYSEYIVVAPRDAIDDFGDVNVYAGSCGTIPPVVLVSPSDASTWLGHRVVFEVDAHGTEPLLYQWYRGGVAVPGATAASLAVHPVTPAEAGAYHVVVTNVAGTAVSASALLALLPDPPDCNGNAVDDALDVAIGTSWDRNLNGIPDECDHTEGIELDRDGNGWLDAWEPPLPLIANRGTTLHDIDPVDGSVSNTRATGLFSMIDVAPDGDGGILTIGHALGSNVFELYRLSPTTGAATLAGSPGIVAMVEGDLAVDPLTGRLFGLTDKTVIGYWSKGVRMFIVDPVTGQASFFGALEDSGIEDYIALAFDWDGELYAVETASWPSRLLHLERETGRVAVEVPLSYDGSEANVGTLGGMTFGLDGTLYFASEGTGGTETTGYLFTIDVATGEMTRISQVREAWASGLMRAPLADCDGDGVADYVQIAAGPASDCNGNGVPDTCDLLAGTVADSNLNGVPDSCESVGPALPPFHFRLPRRGGRLRPIPGPTLSQLPFEVKLNAPPARTSGSKGRGGSTGGGGVVGGI